MMICRNFLLIINWFHNNFQGIHIHGFRKLLQENTETFIQKIPDYLVKTQNMYMFVRVERPKDSRRFVLGYVKCDLVFSFTRRFEQMRVRLNRVPPQLLMKEETEENKVLRLARLGQTDYERAMALHGDTRVGLDDVLLTPLGAAIYAKDYKSAEALLDGEDDPNEVDGRGRNALHRAAQHGYGCRPPLLRRILSMIQNVNLVTKFGYTALMQAVGSNHLDMFTLLMNHQGIDVNIQDHEKDTVLHWAVLYNRPVIVTQLVSDDRVDTSLKNKYNSTPLRHAIGLGYEECVNILREHGASEE